MTKQTMTRKASDNVYLHKDFHGALSRGIEYLDQHYGAEAVRDYLRQFASAYYAPLTQSLKERGLVAMREHLERIYAVEGGKIDMAYTQDELLLKVEACPAVTHMRQYGYAVARLFYETDKTVYETICEGTPFAAEFLAYDPETGRSATRFYRRAM